MEFPLKDIKRILDDPNFDQSAALEDQIKLLELRRKQLGKLIALARETLKTGVTPMKFDAFDKTKQARFAAEVKEKWGGTAAYQEYQQREENGSAGDSAELMAQCEAPAVNAREQYAYAHPDYIALLDGIAAAVETEETLRWQLVAAQETVAIWRTESANNRAIDRAAA